MPEPSITKIYFHLKRPNWNVPVAILGADAEDAPLAVKWRCDEPEEGVALDARLPQQLADSARGQREAQHCLFLKRVRND